MALTGNINAAVICGQFSVVEKFSIGKPDFLATLRATLSNSGVDRKGLGQ